MGIFVKLFEDNTHLLCVILMPHTSYTCLEKFQCIWALFEMQASMQLLHNIFESLIHTPSTNMCLHRSLAVMAQVINVK